MQAQVRFDDRRIGHQGQQAAQVGGAVEEIGVVGEGVAGLGKPLLEQGAVVETTKKGKPTDSNNSNSSQATGLAAVGGVQP